MLNTYFKRPQDDPRSALEEAAASCYKSCFWPSERLGSLSSNISFFQHINMHGGRNKINCVIKTINWNYMLKKENNSIVVTGKTRSVWPADSVFISDPIKKYFVENNCYLQISNPASYVFQLINYEGYFYSRSYNVRINFSFSDILMSNARTCIDSLLSFNDLEMFDILKVLGMFHHLSVLKFLTLFRERSLKLPINIFLETWDKYFCIV